MRRPHTRVVWRVVRLTGRGPNLEFDTRAKARARRAADRARGIDGYVERVALRPRRKG